MLDVHGFGATWLLLFCVSVFVLVAVICIDVWLFEARLLLPTIGDKDGSASPTHLGAIKRD